jgi:CheY-specific phosphatase CheX
MDLIMIDQGLLKTALWDGAKEAFDTMIMLPIEPVESFSDDGDPTGSLVASITFTGSMTGALVIKTPKASAEHVAKSMMMMEADEEIDPVEVNDALGEVANLILGGFKTRIAEPIGEINISVPMVMEGKEVIPAMGSNVEKAEVYAKADSCELRMTVVYKNI